MQREPKWLQLMSRRSGARPGSQRYGESSTSCLTALIERPNTAGRLLLLLLERGHCRRGDYVRHYINDCNLGSQNVTPCTLYRETGKGIQENKYTSPKNGALWSRFVKYKRFGLHGRRCDSEQEREQWLLRHGNCNTKIHTLLLPQWRLMVAQSKHHEEWTWPNLCLTQHIGQLSKLL